MLLMARPNRCCRLEFNSTFSSGFWYGMQCGICHCILSCTAFDIGMSTILYIQVYTSKMPTKICCWDNWSKHVCTLHIPVHTVYIHAHTVYIHVHTLYIGIKYFMLDPLRYFPLLSCLYSLHEVLYYASVQESAFLYMQGSYRSVLPQNGSGRWSAFLWHFAFFMYRRHCTWFHHVQALTYAYVCVFEEMPQESWPPARSILRKYRPLHVQNGWFLYTSIVHHCM